ncbi:hypothetical protein [Marispirochaeta aestuarii]|uniref:hypothetical protein n=1 Tax=Marispirochaeta aestuarii TaxID=1963862 RepID=UPI0029C766C9|nr:hypothetical protein [Marispirochaeta aestuarii]
MGSLQQEIIKMKNQERRAKNEADKKRFEQKDKLYRDKQQYKADNSLELHIGLDFGTSYIKACVRDLGAEESVGIRLFKKTDGFFPVRIALDRTTGSISFAEQEQEAAGDVIIIEYLKMILADMEAPSRPDLTMEDIEAVTLWMLVKLILEIKKRFKFQEEKRCRGRNLKWTGVSLGIPAEYIGSPIERRFERLITFALFITKTELQKRFENTIASSKEHFSALNDKPMSSLADDDEPVFVYPEIVAAIHSFVYNRDMREGYHAYFDIGGGTLDGIVFDYIDVDGQKNIDVLTAKVDSLGIEKACTALLDEPAKEPNLKNNLIKLKAQVFNNDGVPSRAEVSLSLNTSDPAKQIKQHIAKVIFPIKNKDRLGRLNHQDSIPLFIGGGGAASPWYVDKIERTYKDHKHDRCGMPPYKERKIERVPDLTMPGNSDSVYRFLIAYGLSFPPDESIRIVGLSSQHGNDMRELKYKESDRDTIAMNKYGETI